MHIIPESTPIEYPEDASGIGRLPSEPRYPEEVTQQSPQRNCLNRTLTHKQRAAHEHSTKFILRVLSVHTRRIRSRQMILFHCYDLHYLSMMHYGC